METPEPLAMTFDETRDGCEDTLVCDVEIVHKIYEDVIAVSITMFGAGNLEGVEDAGDQTIHLGDKVFCGCHCSMKTTRADKSPNEDLRSSRFSLAMV